MDSQVSVIFGDPRARFEASTRSPYVARILAKVLAHTPSSGRVLEVGIGDGTHAVWLSRRGVQVEGVDVSPERVEQARHANKLLRGGARFRVGDVLHPTIARQSYDVVYHLGFLARFADEQIRAILHEQLACAGHVVFAVPSAFGQPELAATADRLLTVRDWRRILAPFEIVQLEYYGDARRGGREYVAGVLRGRAPASSSAPAGREAARDDLLPVVLHGPLTDASGYAEGGRNLALALDRAGVRLHLNPISWSRFEVDVDPAVRSRLAQLETARAPAPFVHVSYVAPPLFRRDGRARRNVGRTMFETDGLPEDWIRLCRQMDEVWVPTDFNLETFVAAGIPRDRLFKVHEAIDPARYPRDLEPLVLGASPNALETGQAQGPHPAWDEGRHRGPHHPAARPPAPTGRASPRRPLSDFVGEGDEGGEAPFTFLSVFDFQLRKGWDVLLRAYLSEFRPDEGVRLVLKLSSSAGRLAEDIRQVEAFVAQEMGSSRGRHAPIVFLTDLLDNTAMPRLYRSADAFVLPTRGEGWCRPFVESLLLGIPVIATRWGAPLEYLNEDNAYLIDARTVDVPEAGWQEVPTYRGHRWGEPDVDHLRQLLRAIVADPATARRRAEQGRADVLARLTLDRVAEQMLPRLDAGPKPWPAPALTQPVRIAWIEPDGYRPPAAGELRKALDASGWVQWDPGADRAIVAGIGPRPAGARLAFVLVDWPFGPLPPTWRETIREYDGVWVWSEAARAVAIASGIPEDRTAVLPLPVPAMPAARHDEDDRPIRFLFPGGRRWDRGADLVGPAFAAAFGGRSDVELVIVDLAEDRWHARPPGTAPAVTFPASARVMPRPIDPSARAAIITSGDCLVYPYRAEGDCRVVREAIGAGLALVLPRGGPADDWATDDVTAWVRARASPANVADTIVGTVVTTAATAHVLQPDANALIDGLRWAVELAIEARRRPSEDRKPPFGRFSVSRLTTAAFEHLLRSEPGRSGKP